MVNSSVRSPPSCPPSHVGCRLVEEASGMPRRARRVVAARRKRVWVMRRSVGKGGRRGEWRAVHSPRAFGFPSAVYLLGLRNLLPGQCDRRISLPAGLPQRALAARFRPPLVEPALSVSIAYLA